MFKEYKIIEVKEFPASENCDKYIRFTLNDWVKYSDASKKFIDCADTFCFNYWEEGDEIMIDIDDTKRKRSTKTFKCADIVVIRAKCSSRYYSQYQDEKKKGKELQEKLEEETKNWEEKLTESEKHLPIRQWLEFENKDLKEEIKGLKQQIEELQSQLQQTQISVPPKENN